MWLRIGLRTSLAAFDVVGRMCVRRGRPGPRAPSATVSAEWAKIIGKRYVSIGQSLSKFQAMVERCAPTINQARAVCGMVVAPLLRSKTQDNKRPRICMHGRLLVLCSNPRLWAYRHFRAQCKRLSPLSRNPSQRCECLEKTNSTVSCTPSHECALWFSSIVRFPA